MNRAYKQKIDKKSNAKTTGFTEDLFLSYSAMNKCQKAVFVAAFLIATVFLYGMLFSTVKYTADFSYDEPFYLSICERLFRGDKLIVDEWSLPQFTAIFQYLPYFFVRKITGSTEGVVLYMRYVYLVTNCSFYCYIFVRLRKRPWIALLTAFLFCSFVPLGALLFGYYYLPLLFLLAFSVIVVDENARHRIIRLVFAGILLSCSVILNPGLILLWLFYCVFVLLRFVFERRGKNRFSEYDFVLNTHVFKYILFGVLISAIVFLTSFLLICGAEDIIKNISEMVLDGDGTRPERILTFSLMGQHIREIIGKYGIFFWLMVIETMAAIVFKAVKSKAKKAELAKKALFVIGVVICFFAFLRLFIMGITFKLLLLMEAPVFTAWLGAVCCLLCDNVKPKMIFTWLVGATYSFTQDMTSLVTCGFGSVICVFPSASFIIQLCIEICSVETEKKSKKKPISSSAKKLFFGVTVFALSLIILFSITNVVCFTIFFHNNERFGKSGVDVSKGPYKGLNMPSYYKELNDDIISDLETIKELTEGSVYIMGGYPFAYLYFDRDINVPSTGGADNSEKILERYWSVHPEKRVKLIYIPLEAEYSPVYISKDEFNLMPKNQHVDYGWFEGEATKGKAGLIVEVTRWYTADKLK